MAAKKTKIRKVRLSREVMETVREVVATCRCDAASPEMRLISDEIAVDILAEDHGIVVSLARVRKIA